MNWVDYEGVTFNLDHVTHFGIEGDGFNSQLRAYLSFGDAQVEKDPIAYFIVTMASYEECKNVRNKIIAGDYNLPSKGESYSIQESLGKIAELLERISDKL